MDVQHLMESWFNRGGGGDGRHDDNNNHANNNNGGGRGGGGGLGGAIGNLFGGSGFAAAAAFPGMHPGPTFMQQQHQQPSSIPPASKRVLRQLPKIQVRPEDLVDPANRECCICFETFHVGNTVTRLPCGHLFCEKCVLDWLQRNCSCPTCRYELPTDNPLYEIGRIERMKSRKPRFAKHELDRMSVKELQKLLSLQRRRSWSSPRAGQTKHNFIDKQELVEYIIRSDCIDLIIGGAPEPVSYRISELKQMPIKKLKHVMQEDAGVFYHKHDVIEKDDLIKVFVLSGRLHVLPETDDATDMDENVDPFQVEVVDEDDDDRKPPAVDNDDDDRKPPPPAVVVETVHSDDEEEDDDDKQSPRDLQDLVMEENPSFQESSSNNSNNARSRRRRRSAAARPFCGVAAAAAAASVRKKHPPAAPSSTSAAKSSAAAVTSSSSDEPVVAADARRRTTTSATGNGGEDDGIQERFCNLNLNELQIYAQELGVDLTEEMADCKKVHRKIAKKLTEADRRKKPPPPPPPPTASFRGSSSSNSSTSSSSSSHKDEPATTTTSSSARRRSQKRRRTGNSEYGFTAQDLHHHHHHRNNGTFNGATTNGGGSSSTAAAAARYRALQGRSISELKKLAQKHSVDLSGCVERKEMEDRLVPAMTDVEEEEDRSTEAASAAANDVEILSDDVLEDWNVSEIRALANLVDVDLSTSSSNRQAMLDMLRAEAADRPHMARYLRALAPLARLSTAQLRARARSWQVSVDDCLEKSELILRMVKHMIQEATPPPPPPPARRRGGDSGR